MNRDTIKDLTLMLMYLTSWEESLVPDLRKKPDRAEVYPKVRLCWKGYEFDILNELTDEGLVNAGGRRKSASFNAEGSRRYLEALSTYSRRRMTQAARADVDEVLYVPAALALHQRPGVPGIRSTFGTGTELLNSLRLMYSRLASYRCLNGHYLPPTLAVAAEQPIFCPECGAAVEATGAEQLAFNSQGACPTCDGTGTVYTVDESTLVPDESLSIDQGAVAPWQTLMWSLMKDIARELGVRTDVPFRELTEQERDIVFHAPAEKRHFLYFNEKTGTTAEMDFTFYNAIYTVQFGQYHYLIKGAQRQKKFKALANQGILTVMR